MVWRGSIVAAILGLWLTVGIAWGGRAAIVFAFPVLTSCVFAVWAVVAGRMDQRAASWYYERQLRGSPNGRRRRR